MVEADSTAETIDITGAWELVLDVGGRNITLEMNVKQDGTGFSGDVTTPFGSGRINGEIEGRSVEAKVNAAFFEAAVTGKFVGDGIEGDIAIPILPEPASFKGRRV